jgi:guanyl-specific ribonuclease Sa
MVGADTAVADISAADTVAVISAEVTSAEVMATASAACMSAAATISAVDTTPVRDQRSHMRFREGARAAAVLLPVAAGGTSLTTPRCDPQASAAR